ncbi:hypothetical protein F5B21DRAFT_401838 [Xylaria acuta]|nr:hypothetical protein F5B21DRAFT_401838 [Xylaria acuta]
MQVSAQLGLSLLCLSVGAATTMSMSVDAGNRGYFKGAAGLRSRLPITNTLVVYCAAIQPSTLFVACTPGEGSRYGHDKHSEPEHQLASFTVTPNSSKEGRALGIIRHVSFAFLRILANLSEVWAGSGLYRYTVGWIHISTPRLWMHGLCTVYGFHVFECVVRAHCANDIPPVAFRSNTSTVQPECSHVSIGTLECIVLSLSSPAVP